MWLTPHSLLCNADGSHPSRTGPKKKHGTVDEVRTVSRFIDDHEWTFSCSLFSNFQLVSSPTSNGCSCFGVKSLRRWVCLLYPNCARLECTELFLLTSIWLCKCKVSPLNVTCQHRGRREVDRLLWKCDGTREEIRFRFSVKRTSPFKSEWASVQSTTGSRCVRISGSNVGYTMFRGSVKGTGHPLHSPVSPSLPHTCFTMCHRVSAGLYSYTQP